MLRQLALARFDLTTDNATWVAGTSFDRGSTVVAGKLFRIVSTAAALALVCLTAGCDRWRQTPPAPKSPLLFPNGGALTIETIADSDRDGLTSRQTYDVSELLNGNRGAPRATTANQLLATLRTCVPPTRTIELGNDTLIAELTDREHAELARMLDDWRRGGIRQIVVEVRLLNPASESVTPIAWNRVPIEKSGVGGLPILGARITESQLIQLLRDEEQNVHDRLLSRPKFTLLNGQSLTFSDVVSTPFVTSVIPQSNGALQPVMEVVDEGVKVTMRPSTKGDGLTELSVELSAAEIGEVAEVQLPLLPSGGSSAPITVQAPTVAAVSARAVVRLAADESFLIAVPGSPDPKHPKTPTLTNFFIFTPYLRDEENANVSAMTPTPSGTR